MLMRTRNVVVIVGSVLTLVLMCLCVVGVGYATDGFADVRANVGGWFAQGGDPDKADADAVEVVVAAPVEVPSAGRGAMLAEQPAPTPEVVVYTETVVFTNTVVFTQTLTVTDTAASEALGAAIVAEAEAEAEAIRMDAAALLGPCEKDSQPTAWESDERQGMEWQIGSPDETCWILVEWRLDVCPVDSEDEPAEASEVCWAVFMVGPGQFAIMSFDTAGTVYVLGPEWDPANRHEDAQENIAVGMYDRWVANGGDPSITVPTNSIPPGTVVKYVDENGVTQIVEPENDWPTPVHYQAERILEELALPVDEPVEAYP